jgi:hypothetical protein
MIDEVFPPEYFNIDYLTNMMYDYIYNKQTTKCYVTPSTDLDIKNLNLIDIKYTPETIENIKQIINNIFNTNIIFDYKKLNKYYFKRETNVYKTIIELELYSSNDKDNLNTSENMNSVMTYILSDLVIKKIIKNIYLIIMCIDIPLKNMLDFIEKFPEIKELLSIPINNKYFRVTIYENFFKLINLDLYLENEISVEKCKIIIIQIIHTLFIIQQKYPSFIHNNLKVKNIKIYETKEKTDHFTFNNEKISFFNTGLKIKI